MVYQRLLLAGILIFSFTGLHSIAHSAIYYLSPSGSDTNAGTSAASWKTFSFAIPKLQPGDTLILKNGTYNGTNSGYLFIDGATNANNGTSAKIITVKAENERQAFFEGTGAQRPIEILNLSYWAFEGLHAKSADLNGSNQADAAIVRASDHLTFKHLLLTHNNRYKNSHLLNLDRCDTILVEESEFYYFHRHAILSWITNNSTYRRNYANSRGYADIPGGFPSAATNRGETLISVYPGSNTIVENNISEGSGAFGDIQATLVSDNNKFLGNISLNDHYGIYLAARGTSNQMPMNTLIENLVVINPVYVGIYARGTKKTWVKNVSVFGGPSGLIADYQAIYPGDGIYSVFSENTLVMNHSSTGIRTIDQTIWSHDYDNVYNNATNFYPTTNVTNIKTFDPGFDTCRVFVPNSSPLKKKGVEGRDIGANILYRYEKGGLTNQRLWDATTGAFPHGALVGGVNDIAGSSAFDVHKRLNVNANGCALPENYGAEGEPDLTPMNLRRVVTLG